MHLRSPTGWYDRGGQNQASESNLFSAPPPDHALLLPTPAPRPGLDGGHDGRGLDGNGGDPGGGGGLGVRHRVGGRLLSVLRPGDVQHQAAHPADRDTKVKGRVFLAVLSRFAN